MCVLFGTVCSACAKLAIPSSNEPGRQNILLPGDIKVLRFIGAAHLAAHIKAVLQAQLECAVAEVVLAGISPAVLRPVIHRNIRKFVRADAGATVRLEYTRLEVRYHRYSEVFPFSVHEGTVHETHAAGVRGHRVHLLF